MFSQLCYAFSSKTCDLKRTKKIYNHPIVDWIWRNNWNIGRSVNIAPKLKKIIIITSNVTKLKLYKNLSKFVRIDHYKAMINTYNEKCRQVFWMRMTSKSSKHFMVRLCTS